MATIPTIESVLLEVLQALDLDELQSKTKEKFKKRQMTLKNHQQMVVEVFQDICRELELNVEAKGDVLLGLYEAAAFHLELENSIWTSGADTRQILWYVLGYTWMPFLGRKIAFWQLDEPMDADMPGGEFWYLPQVRQKDGKPKLRMPVAAVLDWLLDLTGLSMDKMSSFLGGGYDEKTKVNIDSPEVIERTLYNWLAGTKPRATNIASIFRDSCELPFTGAFTVDENLELAEKFKAAKQFIESKGLSPEDLRHEVPMITPGVIEQVLAGQTDNEATAHFINLLSARYAIPSMKTVRKRLYIARAVQHGYRKLIKTLCPSGFEETCADPTQNKVLQLLDIYKYAYNLTIDAHIKCETRRDEEAWFESHIPPWYASELFYSILPSSNADMRETAKAVGTSLSKRYVELQGGEELENLLGWDERSTEEIAKRELLNLKKDVTRIEECQSLRKKFDRDRLGERYRELTIIM